MLISLLNRVFFVSVLLAIFTMPVTARPTEQEQTMKLIVNGSEPGPGDRCLPSSYMMRIYLFPILASIFIFMCTSLSHGAVKATPETLEKVNAMVKPGSVVLLGEGTYRVAINPARSGTENNPIVYQAARGARPVFKEVSPAIFIKGRSWIQIEGIRFLDTPRFMRIESSDHITIENCHFENGKEWESCSLKKMGDYFLFKNNVLQNGTDLLSIQGGSHHLIEGNTFHQASHTCLVFMGVHDSVIRNNHLSNPLQKLLEIFATRSREWSGPYRKSQHIVIENNIFGPNSHGRMYKGKEPPASWGTQFAGVKCIVRRNIFAGCDGGMDLTGYGEVNGDGDSPEAVFNNQNRFYHNTIYANGQQGRYGSGPGILLSHGKETEYFDQLFVNNIVYANRIFKDAHTRQTVPSVQIAFRSPAEPAEARFLHNDILAEQGEEKIVFWLKRENRGFTLAEFQHQYPSFAQGNIGKEPGFKVAAPDLKDPRREDYQLKKGSPCIDAGGFLTRTISAGNGTSVKVLDALFFSDGMGVVAGDILRIGKERVKVVKVDYPNHIIQVDQKIRWKKDEGVTLSFTGKAPDIGAFEFE